MPIRKYIPGATFGPEIIKDMEAAFEGARTILNIDNPDDPLIEVVAKKVVSLASQGIIGPAEIVRRVVADTELDLRKK
jgi:hypothetical protein